MVRLNSDLTWQRRETCTNILLLCSLRKAVVAKVTTIHYTLAILHANNTAMHKKLVGLSGWLPRDVWPSFTPSIWHCYIHTAVSMQVHVQCIRRAGIWSYYCFWFWFRIAWYRSRRTSTVSVSDIRACKLCCLFLPTRWLFITLLLPNWIQYNILWSCQTIFYGG